MKQQIKNIIEDSIQTKQLLMQSETLIQTVEKVSSLMIEAFKNGGSVWFCGNGGSAADAQHIAAELSGRYYFDRPPLPSEALHVNTSYLTAVANDYGYDKIYSRYISGLGKKGDVLVGISTSGNSENILNAFEAAKKKGLKIVAMTGESGGKMKDLSDFLLNVPSKDTPRIQESHIMLGHIICGLVEETLFGNDRS